MKNKKGFTLIELLAVIVVIAVIATIGIFSVAKIIDKARIKALTDTAFAARKATLLDIANNSDLPFIDGVATLDLTPGNSELNIPRGANADIMDMGKDPWGKDYKLVIAKITKISTDSVKVDVYFTLQNDEIWFLPAGETEMVKLTNIAGISDTNGEYYVGATVTAGDPLPSSTTATYQWQVANTSNGTYSDILGANSINYVITSNELNKYIRVKATANGNFTGTVYSNPSNAIKYELISVGNITGSNLMGSTLTAGSLIPGGATVNYQWQRATTSNGSYSDIIGANNNTYVTGSADVGKYIRVQATGTGNYAKTVNSSPISSPIYDPIVASFNFESNGLSGWTYTGTWIPTIINTVGDPTGSALSGTYSVDLKANYSGSVSCAENATHDTIMYRDFVLSAGTYTFSFKSRNSLGSTGYDKTRITIYNVTDGNSTIKEWSTAGCGAGTLVTGTGINFGALTTYTHNFTIASAKTIRFYARTHNGGWQSHLLLDDITLTQN